jgi:hypothetical protein
MKNKILFLAVMLLGATAVFGQNSETDKPVQLGLKFGIPVTDMMSANTSLFGGNQQLPGSAYTSSAPRYILGASAEFKLPYRLRFEVDGLFRRGGFNSSLPVGPFSALGNYQQTSFNQWEIPGLFKYNIALGHYRPFVDVGATYRHISTISQRTFGPAIVGAGYTDNAGELANRNSFGGVAGIGITFKKGPLELTPEARYTRWANKAFIGNGLSSNLDQGDVLLGITF